MSAPTYHVRVSKAKYDSSKKAELLALYHEKVLPTYHKQDGFVKGYVLAADDSDGELLVVTAWNSEEKAEAFLHSESFAKGVELAKHFLVGGVETKKYHLVE